MVLGLGVDIVEVRRIAELAKRWDERFLARVFTSHELSYCGGSFARLAGRFASKEAFTKAVGTGLRGFAWREIEVHNDSAGAPSLRLSPRLRQRFSDSIFHLSISHGEDHAVAVVLREAASAQPMTPSDNQHHQT